MDAQTFRVFEEAYRRAGPRAALVAYAGLLRKASREADRVLDWLTVAGCYAEAGEADRAFALLDEAFAARDPWLLHLVADPAFEPIRGDPRYAALLRGIGIPMARAAAAR